MFHKIIGANTNYIRRCFYLAPNFDKDSLSHYLSICFLQYAVPVCNAGNFLQCKNEYPALKQVCSLSDGSCDSAPNITFPICYRDIIFQSVCWGKWNILGFWWIRNCCVNAQNGCIFSEKRKSQSFLQRVEKYHGGHVCPQKWNLLGPEDLTAYHLFGLLPHKNAWANNDAQVRMNEKHLGVYVSLFCVLR